MSTMADIRDTFFEECAEQLMELETGLLAMEQGETDSETVNAVFRAVHSIKGGAGAFELTDLVAFAHVFETVLDKVRSDTLEPDAGVMRILLRSADTLNDLVTCARDGGEINAEHTATLIEELRELAGHSHQAADANEPAFEFVPVAIDLDDIFAPSEDTINYVITFTPHDSLYANANESARLIRELGALGTATVTTNFDDLPPLDDLDPETSYLSFTIELSTSASESSVREVFEFVEGDCELTLVCENGVSDADLSLPSDAVDEEFALLMASLTSGQAETPPSDKPYAPSESEAAASLLDALNPKLALMPAPAEISAPANATAEQAEPAASAATESLAVPQAEQAAAKPAKPAAAANDAAANVAKPTIRVDLARVDHLIDLVGELVIQQVMLAQRVGQAGLAAASEVAVGLDELEQLTRSMQECVMSIRAQQVKSVFQKLPRLVREVADATGKEVRLVTEGETTEVDKTVIERLSDPLTHMIRNAIDHGLETPDERLAAGKPETGTVRVAAMHRSGRIVIEIGDDGAGINRKVVFDIAVSKGLIAADATLTDDEIDNLIFLPGFSTRAEVSELSGRGVGMDVVKRSIQALGGRISISSIPGKGSLFTLSLPLTLAVLDGMIVTSGSETLVVPLTAIIETLRPESDEIKAFGGNSSVIKVRDSFIPIVDVANHLGYRNTTADPTTSVIILAETENGQIFGLLFDAIQGQRQVVIKSLEANYGRVPGIAAATILGDGRVALIIDVDTMADNARNRGAALPVAA